MTAIRYIVADVPTAKRFYVEQLGFQVAEEWGDVFVALTRDGTKLWLAGPETSAAKPMPDGRIPVPGGWNRIVVETMDLEAMVDRLKAAGAVFRNTILKGPGGSQVLIEDPSGNPIELFEPRQR